MKASSAMDMKTDKGDESKVTPSDLALYPKLELDLEEVALPAPAPAPAPAPQDTLDPTKSKSSPKSVSWSSKLTSEAPSENLATTMPSPDSNNPYASRQSSSLTVKNTVSTVKDVLGKWGKKVGETTKKGQDLAGNVWQHLQTGPSVVDTAMGRIAQGSKVLAEGGYEKIFQRTFETVPEEQLQRTYACYLSTSAGPVMGILYLSTAKLAFCSDNPLPYKVGEQSEWSYYKVVIPLHQLKAVNKSTSRVNRSEKYIQVISVDNHEFWFMGFVNYDSAVKYLEEALQSRNLQSE